MEINNILSISHQFLRDLNTASDPNIHSIIEVAKGNLQLAADTREVEVITRAVKVVMADAAQMPSLEEGKGELQGAIKAVNSLVPKALATEKRKLEKELQLLSEKQDQIQDIFFLKEAIGQDVSLMPQLK